MRKWLHRHTPDQAAIDGNRWLAPFRTTLLHPRLWHLNRRSAAGGVAVGLFCGLIPGPFQMLGAAICAVVFRINLPLALTVTLYTNPFTIVPLYIAAYGLGKWFSGPGAPFMPPPEYEHAAGLIDWVKHLLDWLNDLGEPLLIGLVLLASLLAMAGYGAVRALWRMHLVGKWKRRQRNRKYPTKV